jgi:predicted RNase H-like nuclease
MEEPAVYDSFDALVAGPASIICIDIPIGLVSGHGQRTCDVEARKLLGRRRSSVFPPPCRDALNFRGLEASDENYRVAEKRLSLQTRAIVPKIHEVDSKMTPYQQSRVKEVHPELCFYTLNSRRPLVHAKKEKARAGVIERWQILRKVLPQLGPDPDLPSVLRGRGCAIDDYIDAIVAAWTAACIRDGLAARIPEDPVLDERQLRMEMWLPSR